MPSVFSELGVRPVINAAGTKTRLGGIPMASEVWDAMRAAGDFSVDMAELQAVASRIIARVTGAEAGYVTSGAAAAMTLSAAACLSGSDPAKIDMLPHTSDIPHEIVIARPHRNSYDHAWRAAGARLVEVGVDDRTVGSGVRDVEPWEYEVAIGSRTVAVAFVATRDNLPLLKDVVNLAHAHDLPVLVDAAAQLPPAENLRNFIEAGADLVAFSGGKAIGGPQATGFLAGKRALMGPVMLNHLDLDVRSDLWSLPEELFSGNYPLHLPRHGIGRGFKVSKENIVGLLTALVRFSSGAWKEQLAAKQLVAERLCEELRDSKRIIARKRDAYGYPVVDLTFIGPDEATAFYKGLLEGSPSVAVDPIDIESGKLRLNTIGLSSEDGRTVVAAVKRLHDTFNSAANPD